MFLLDYPHFFLFFGDKLLYFYWEKYMDLKCLTDTPQGTLFHVLAVPRSSKTEIADLREDRCRIKVKAPPVDGEANAALLTAIAKWFDLPKKSVVQQKGLTGKQKTFLLSGLSLEQAKDKLQSLL